MSNTLRTLYETFNKTFKYDFFTKKSALKYAKIRKFKSKGYTTKIKKTRKWISKTRKKDGYMFVGFTLIVKKSGRRKK